MSLANLLREAKGGACPEWRLDKEILEKNARNKIRVHQCLPIVKKNIGEAKVGLTKHHSRAPPFIEKLRSYFPSLKDE